MMELAHRIARELFVPFGGESQIEWVLQCLQFAPMIDVSWTPEESVHNIALKPIGELALNAAPPFPVWWMESRVQLINNGPDGPMGRAAWLCVAHEVTPFVGMEGFDGVSDAKWVLEVLSLLGMPGQRVTAETGYNIFVRDDGKPYSKMILAPAERYGNHPDGTNIGDAGIHALMSVRTGLWPVLSGLNVLHCKNGGLAAHDIPPEKAKRMERRFGPREGGYRFHTLTVRVGGSKPRELSEVMSQADHGKALHLVRSHYATYTADRPLFGHLTGTFFRPAHIRGDAKNGIVEKDYAIAGGNQ